MDAATTARILAALGHEGRLTIFRMLAQAGSRGLPAGEIARRAGHLQNTTSTHLGVLSNVGLIVGRREGRSIIYAATHARLAEAVEFAAEGFFEGSNGTAYFERLRDCLSTSGSDGDRRLQGDAA